MSSTASPYVASHPGQIPVLTRWLVHLHSHTKRSFQDLAADGLMASDFTYQTVSIQFEDGSVVSFHRAFFLTDEARPGIVAIFTEHCGYHEFLLTSADKLQAGPTSFI